jgi:hypothetical protein
MKLHFDHALVTRLLAHAEAATEHTPTFAQLCDKTFHREGVTAKYPTSEDLDLTKIPPGLMLVGDLGVYLMSNGTPGLAGQKGTDHLVAYAEEVDPQINPEGWYDMKQSSFGADDGAEFLSAECVRKALEATVNGKFWLNVTAQYISAPSRAPDNSGI